MISVFLQRSFRRQLEEHRPSLYKVAWSWCHQTALADDLVQETYVKALKNRSQLKDVNKLKPWLMRILVNVHIDYLRTNRDQVSIEDSHILDFSDPTTVINREDNIQKVRGAIARLNEDHRIIITLVDLTELSYTEVSEVLNIPVGTVMSRLNRARKNLKELLEEKSCQVQYLRRVK